MFLLHLIPMQFCFLPESFVTALENFNVPKKSNKNGCEGMGAAVFRSQPSSLCGLLCLLCAWLAPESVVLCTPYVSTDAEQGHRSCGYIGGHEKCTQLSSVQQSCKTQLHKVMACRGGALTLRPASCVMTLIDRLIFTVTHTHVLCRVQCRTQLRLALLQA